MNDIHPPMSPSFFTILDTIDVGFWIWLVVVLIAIYVAIRSYLLKRVERTLLIKRQAVKQQEKDMHHQLMQVFQSLDPKSDTYMSHAHKGVLSLLSSQYKENLHVYTIHELQSYTSLHEDIIVLLTEFRHAYYADTKGFDRITFHQKMTELLSDEQVGV